MFESVTVRCPNKECKRTFTPDPPNSDSAPLKYQLKTSIRAIRYCPHCHTQVSVTFPFKKTDNQ